MYRRQPTRFQRFAQRSAISAAVAWLCVLGPLAAQNRAEPPDWRRVGGTALDVGLAGYASGPVDRIWFSADGSAIFARTFAGRVFSTSDLESWRPSAASPAERRSALTPTAPEREAFAVQANRTRFFAAGRFVYRSDDGGASWTNLTHFRGQSLLGEGILDLAVSPANADEVVVAARTGVWRSVDGGASWLSLNESLPNLPVVRLLATPNGLSGAEIATDTGTFVWNPGEREAWREQGSKAWVAERERNERLTSQLGGRISASAAEGEFVYAGASDGRLWSSTDGGQTWRLSRIAEAPITRILVDPTDPRLALATAGARANGQAAPVHVLRTLNGGAFWDDMTANLPDVPVSGVTLDRASGSVYVAAANGVYWTTTDLRSLAPATPWRLVEGLGLDVAPKDVRLDGGGHQLYVALEGFGIYATTAPHRGANPQAVSAADLVARAVAPGSLLTVFGAEVRTASANGRNAPVLAADSRRTEIQVPFEAQGQALALTLQAANGPLRLGLVLEPTSPAVFVDRDGTPLLLDADSGVLLDARTPARSGTRLQVLATGLGQVKPDWPSGVPAPVEEPPAVVAKVRAWLDRQPVDVTRAVLAPGYVGFYLVEIQLPKLINAGPAELYLEAEGRESNRVRLYLQP
jgi:uncharacterized protein (TIGR03437 family)